MAFCEVGHVEKNKRPAAAVYERGAQRRPVFYVTNTDGVIWCLAEEHAAEFDAGIKQAMTLESDYKLRSVEETLAEVERRQGTFAGGYLAKLKKTRSRL